MNGFRNGTWALGMVLLVAATSADAQDRGPLSLAKASYNAAIAGVVAQWLDRQRLRERQAGR